MYLWGWTMWISCPPDIWTQWRSSTSDIMRSKSWLPIAPTNPQISCLYASARMRSMGHLICFNASSGEKSLLKSPSNVAREKSVSYSDKNFWPALMLKGRKGVSYGRSGRTARFIRSKKNIIFMMKGGIFSSSDFPSAGIPIWERYCSISRFPGFPRISTANLKLLAINFSFWMRGQIEEKIGGSSPMIAKISSGALAASHIASTPPEERPATSVGCWIISWMKYFRSSPQILYEYRLGVQVDFPCPLSWTLSINCPFERVSLGVNT